MTQRLFNFILCKHTTTHSNYSFFLQVPFLVLLCAYAKVISGFLILIDYYIAATIDLVLYLFITTSVRCVYYSKAREPEFNVCLQGFMQNMTFLGAILFYIEMKITIGRNQSKKKAPKTKKT
uniref:Putative ovule protein n=2 Tax=Solanum chacoense TaxID=4108 RepID=A0A0V0HQ98_SOLCH